jgi:LEA14-like dessication related protein
MPTSRRALLLGSAVCLLTLAGCANLNKLLAGAFQRPRLAFKRADVGAVSLSGATVNLVYDVENPNPVGLNLAQVSYAFFVEGKQVVAGTPPNGLRLKASGPSELVFPASVKFADVVPVVTTFLTKDAAAYKAQGSLGIQTPIGVLSFPLEHEGTFPVPKLPQVTLAPPRIKSLGLSGATVEFPLTITNRNGFPLPINGLTGALNIAGANVGTLSTGDLGSFAAGAEKKVTLPLQINFARAASAAAALRSGSAAQVGFSGQVLSGAGAGIPLSFTQRVPFTR